MGKIFSYLNHKPLVDENTFLAPGSYIIGDAVLMEGVSIWYNTVIRADVNKVHIGRFSNIQDNSTVHEDSGRVGSGLSAGRACIIGEYVTVGHNCVLHACTIEDYCLIGMGAIILDGAIIGKGSVVGAGAVVTKGALIPPFSVVVGTPGKVIKTLDENTQSERMNHAMHYYRLAMENKRSLLSCDQ